jgi:hypothetical protein
LQKSSAAQNFSKILFIKKMLQKSSAAQKFRKILFIKKMLQKSFASVFPKTLQNPLFIFCSIMLRKSLAFLLPNKNFVKISCFFLALIKIS